LWCIFQWWSLQHWQRWFKESQWDTEEAKTMVTWNRT
jgi:hypothetical protein